PSLIRFPKGSVPEAIPALRVEGDVDILSEDGRPDAVCDLLVVGIGSMVATAQEVADKLRADGVSVRVVDPRWVLPVSSHLVSLGAHATAVAVIEDNVVGSGVGAAISHAMSASQSPHHPVWCFGVRQEFLDHGSRAQVLERVGLTPDSIATTLISRLGNQTRSL
ncbi:MAG: transketolase C-terminal domain-containing protein, partial [Ornithinimicrobium sp.]